MTTIEDELRALRGVDVPPVDPSREAALLAAFDRGGSRPRRTARWSVVGLAAAAVLALATLSLNWLVARSVNWTEIPLPEVSGAAKADPALDLDGFVEWPGASAWPPMESGSLQRVELPVSMLPAIGLSAPASEGAVPADIVVGQDGLTRAVRLVQSVQRSTATVSTQKEP